VQLRLLSAHQERRRRGEPDHVRAVASTVTGANDVMLMRA
jgi:hypothetical protein